jgi:hypothetical protein
MASYKMSTRTFPGVKRPGLGINHPSHSSAEVKERVELYLYSTSVPPWQVIVWTLRFRTVIRNICHKSHHTTQWILFTPDLSNTSIFFSVGSECLVCTGCWKTLELEKTAPDDWRVCEWVACNTTSTQLGRFGEQSEEDEVPGKGERYKDSPC